MCVCDVHAHTLILFFQQKWSLLCIDVLILHTFGTEFYLALLNILEADTHKLALCMCTTDAHTQVPTQNWFHDFYVYCLK